jgi:hypothetical protein
LEHTDGKVATEAIRLLLPESTARDAAIGTFASVIGERRPAVAFALAETISADDARTRHLEEAARHWLRIAPEKAGRAIADSSLPSDVLPRLFGRMRQ